MHVPPQERGNSETTLPPPMQLHTTGVALSMAALHQILLKSCTLLDCFPPYPLILKTERPFFTGIKYEETEVETKENPLPDRFENASSSESSPKTT